MFRIFFGTAAEERFRVVIVDVRNETALVRQELCRIEVYLMPCCLPF